MGASEQAGFSFQLLKSMESDHRQTSLLQDCRDRCCRLFRVADGNVGSNATTTSGQATILDTARNCIFVLVAGRAKPYGHIRFAGRFMDASEFCSHHDQRHRLAERTLAHSVEHSSISTGSPSFEAANRSRSSIPCFRTGIKLRGILQARPERLRPTSARLWPLKWNRSGVQTRSFLDFCL